MKDGFIKVAAITPNVKVADVDYNCQEIVKRIQEAAEKDAKVMVFPELSITGYTCQDLFLQDALLEAAKCGLKSIKNYSRNIDGIIFVGLPLDFNGKLYNVAAAISRGKIQGIVPKIDAVNTVGCGDSMIAGFALSFSQGLTFTEALKKASAISAASAMTEETGRFNLSDMEKLINQITIEKIG